jgi:hypothetical protein
MFLFLENIYSKYLGVNSSAKKQKLCMCRDKGERAHKLKLKIEQILR